MVLDTLFLAWELVAHQIFFKTRLYRCGVIIFSLYYSGFSGFILMQMDVAFAMAMRPQSKELDFSLP